MGIAMGYLCFLCFCLLAAKALTRKFHCRKADKVLMGIHKTVCVIFLVTVILHIIFVIPVIKMRHILVLVTGILTAAAMILLIALCHTIRQKNLNLALHRILSAVMLICIAGHVLVYAADFRNYQTKIKNIQIGETILSGIQDGNYIGDYDAGYIYAKVEVTVYHERITAINILEHDHERGASAEAVVDKVVDEQRVNADAVSGATNSSLVIEKAIEKALKQ